MYCLLNKEERSSVSHPKREILIIISLIRCNNDRDRARPLLLLPPLVGGKICRITWHCDVTPPPPSNQSLLQPSITPSSVFSRFEIRQTHTGCSKTGFFLFFLSRTLLCCAWLPLQYTFQSADSHARLLYLDPSAASKPEVLESEQIAGIKILRARVFQVTAWKPNDYIAKYPATVCVFFLKAGIFLLFKFAACALFGC